jgi:hypothetical protein
MKRFAAVAGLAVCFACPLMGQQGSIGVADSPTLRPTRPQVVKFMEVMQVRLRLQSTIQMQQEDIRTVTHNMLHKALPEATPAQKARFETIVSDALGEVFTNYPFDDVLRDMIPIYQSHFSESDLNQIVAFYSSAVGQKLLKEMPAMSAEVVRVSETRLQPQIDEMMKNLTARLQEWANETEAPAAPR